VVIDLYHAHGTMEPFHSELKTDLDVERLPSGKFDTNNLVLHFAILAYNLLRIIGQESLKLITLAAKVTTHARRRYLKLGKRHPWFATFQRLYLAFG